MATALLLCAIRVEFDALSAALTDRNEHFNDGRLYVSGVLDADGVRWEVGIAEVGAGNIAAALETSAATARFDPDITVFVGIAGGVKDVDLGDVVIANYVYTYESGKEDAHGIRPRPRGGDFSVENSSIATSLLRNSPDKLSYKIFLGPIAAGEKVVASNNASTAKLLKQNYSDSLAVEMEGGGFVQAMKRQPERKYALIRGISDLLESKAESDGAGWQVTAAANATEVAVRYLAKFSSVHNVAPHGPALLAAKAVKKGRLSITASAEIKSLAQNLNRSLPTPSPSQLYALLSVRKSERSTKVIESGLPIDLILDLDIDTDTDGVFTQTIGALRQTRLVRKFTPIDSFPESATDLLWLAARGLRDGSTPDDDTLRCWIRTWRRKFISFVEDYCSRTGGRHLTVIVADNDDWPWQSKIIEDLLSIFEDRCSVVLLSSNNDIENSDFDQTVYISTDNIAPAMKFWLGPKQDAKETDFLLPTADGTVSLTQEDRVWVTQEITPVWIGSGGGSNNDTGVLVIHARRRCHMGCLARRN